MLKTLAKPLGALFLSLTLAFGAVGASTTQARADAEDVAIVLGGLLALYAIGSIVSSNNDAHQPHPQPTVLRAPQSCFIRGDNTTNGRHYAGYLRHCMTTRASNASHLPDSCLRVVHTHQGPRNIYGAQCLHNNGWVRG